MLDEINCYFVVNMWIDLIFKCDKTSPEFWSSYLFRYKEGGKGKAMKHAENENVVGCAWKAVERDND